MNAFPTLAAGLILAGLTQGAADAASYGTDALPSAEVRAFQRLDARLRYRDARIEHDARGCAVYQGVRRDGRVQRRALLDARGRRICAPRP